tara:strand:- start:673 stop:897 length:225 start_codon:yes stop_codon:yes gene_type:complete
MGFHKRYISNDQVIEIYRTNGMQKVHDWFTRGADAVITEAGLASKVHDLMVGKKWNWNEVSELISNESIKKGFE